MKPTTSPKKGSPLHRCEQAVRTFALSFPESYEDFPWGDRAMKVNKKMFVCMGCSAAALTFSVKAPRSAREVLLQPGFEPTGYGLGKSGWVSGRFEDGDAIPMPLIERLIEESYRAVAPRKLVAAMDAGGPAAGARVKRSAKKTSRKKA